MPHMRVMTPVVGGRAAPAARARRPEEPTSEILMLEGAADLHCPATIFDAPATQTGCEPYNERNLLDRLSRRATLGAHHSPMMGRQRALVDRRLGLTSGEVLSIGAGWHPGRHLFPAPGFLLVAVDSNPDPLPGGAEAGRADAAVVGGAGALDLPDGRFDVVLYRLVLHHIAFQGPLQPCFAEA